jgi:hypothetical protein
VSRDDLTPEDVLTAAELRAHYRTRSERALSCSDGFCGGCPRCGVPLDEPETEEALS